MTLKKIKTISWAKAIFLLVFSHNKLIKHSVDCAIDREIRSASISTYLTPNQEYDLRSKYNNLFRDSVSRIRSSLLRAFCLVLLSIIAALSSAVAFNSLSINKSSILNSWLQYGGIGLLLWATLGRAESEAETFDTGSLPELVDTWVYRFLYITGSYSLILSVAW
ncbi:MAG: hypothetical protein LLF28_06695 [Nitrospiraceae bacterium]|nr:hypothetical protein [Nitrospiraceae bacterium]